MSRVRLQATLVITYNCDPKNFGTDDPWEIARQSREWFARQIEHEEALIEEGDEYTLIVEPAGP